MLNDDESTKTADGKIANGYSNGSAKTNGHAAGFKYGSDILANGSLRNGTGDHAESAKKRL